MRVCATWVVGSAWHLPGTHALSMRVSATPNSAATSGATPLIPYLSHLLESHQLHNVLHLIALILATWLERKLRQTTLADVAARSLKPARCA